MALLQPGTRLRPQRDARAGQGRAPGGDQTFAEQDRADHRAGDGRRPAAGADEHARHGARAVRPGSAGRPRVEPGGHGRVHRRRTGPGALPLPRRTVGVHLQPDRQDRLLSRRLRRSLRALHRRRDRRDDQRRRRQDAARRCRRQPARFIGVRRRTAWQGLPRELRRPPQLHRCRAAGGAAAVRRAARRIDVRVGRARVLGLPGTRRQGPGGRRATVADRLWQQRRAGGGRRRSDAGAHGGLADRLPQPHGGVGDDPARRLGVAADSHVRVREPERQHRPVRRLPALRPFLRAARGQQTLRALDRADARPGRRAQLRLGEVHRHPVPARRPHAGADDAAAAARSSGSSTTPRRRRMSRRSGTRTRSCAWSPACGSTTTTCWTRTNTRGTRGWRCAGT